MEDQNNSQNEVKSLVEVCEGDDATGRDTPLIDDGIVAEAVTVIKDQVQLASEQLNNAMDQEERDLVVISDEELMPKLTCGVKKQTGLRHGKKKPRENGKCLLVVF